MKKHAVLIAAVVAFATACGAGGYSAAPEVSAPSALPSRVGDVLTYRGDAARTGSMPGPGPTGHPSVVWQFQAGGPIESSAAVVDGIVFVVSDDGVVHALELSSGEERWTSMLGAETGAASPLVVKDRVIVGDMDGILHALNASSGREAWRLQTDGPISGAAGASGSEIVSATQSGTAYSVDAVSGEITWQAELPGGVSRSIALTADTAFFGAAGGFLVALDLSDGRALWSIDAATAGEVGTPTVSGGRVYAATGLDTDEPGARGVVAVDAAIGAQLWRYASPAGAQIYTPAVVGDRAYVVGHDRNVVALDAASGTTLWSTTTGAENEALPCVAASVVYVPTNGGSVQALDAADGALRWQAEIKGVPYAPVVVGGYVIVGTSIGVLYAIGQAFE